MGWKSGVSVTDAHGPVPSESVALAKEAVQMAVVLEARVAGVAMVR